MKILDTEIVINRRLLRLVRLRNEEFDYIRNPDEFIAALKAAPAVRASLLTFLQEQHELEPKHPFYHEPHSISVVPVSTYDHWLARQIDAKTRNMIRKAGKSGVELRVTPCDGAFIQGVADIYNEAPVRQGRKFWHYGIDFEGARAHLETFMDRSRFVGAYHGSELIGFFKLTRNTNSASVMQIISKMAHRDKAPNNALLAKAVELCAEQGIPYLQYGTWGRGGLADYKIKHGFLRFDVPRYYVPLNPAGELALRLKLHRRPVEFIPEPLMNRLVDLRGSWYAWRNAGPAVPMGQ